MTYPDPPTTESLKRSLEYKRLVPRVQATCPHCRSRFAPPRTQHAAVRAGSISPPRASRPQTQPEPERPGNVVDAAVAERIRMLSALHDDGLLTDEEFREKKAAVFARWPHPADALGPSLAPREQIPQAPSPHETTALPEPPQMREWGDDGPPQTAVPPLHLLPLPPPEERRAPGVWWPVAMFVLAVAWLTWWFFLLGVGP